MTPEPGVSKACAKCGEVKLLTEFYTRKSAQSGKQSNCKTCQIKNARDWETRNPDKAIIYDKTWQARNPGNVAARSKAWRDRNPDMRATMDLHKSLQKRYPELKREDIAPQLLLLYQTRYKLNHYIKGQQA